MQKRFKEKIKSTKFFVMLIATAVVILAMFLDKSSIGMSITTYLTLCGIYMGANAYQSSRTTQLQNESQELNPTIGME